jgi:hypothetical protein
VYLLLPSHKLIFISSQNMSAEIDQVELAKAPAEGGDYEATKTYQEDTRGEDISHEAPTPTRFQIKKFSQFLGRNVAAQSIYGAATGFLVYFAMYGIRKPFKAAKFEDENGDKIMWYVRCLLCVEL